MKALIISSPNIRGRGGNIRSYYILRNIGKYLQTSSTYIIAVNTPQHIMNELRSLGYNIYGLNIGTKNVELAITKLIVNILNQVKSWNNFDVIISHSEHPLYVIPTYIISRVLQIPWTVIVNSHMYINPSYTYNRNRMLTLPRFVRSLLAINATNKTLVHLISNAIQEELAKAGFRFRYYDVLNIPVGIDQDSINKAIMRENDKNYDAAYMGVFTQEKGIYDLLLIAYKFKKIINKPLRILMLGKFEDRNEEHRFRTMSSKLGISDSFIFKGYLTGIEKYLELAKARLFLFPSHVDVFPISIIEALALGLPAITWDLPYARQFNTASVIKVNSINSFVSAMMNLLLNENYLSSLSKEARKYTSRFTWENAALCEYKAYIKTIEWWTKNS